MDKRWNQDSFKKKQKKHVFSAQGDVLVILWGFDASAAPPNENHLANGSPFKGCEWQWADGRGRGWEGVVSTTLGNNKRHLSEPRRSPNFSSSTTGGCCSKADRRREQSGDCKLTRAKREKLFRLIF